MVLVFGVLFLDPTAGGSRVSTAVGELVLPCPGTLSYHHQQATPLM